MGAPDSGGLLTGVSLPRTTPPKILERMLEHQIEVAADYNTWWYLQQWQAGRKPACCAGCAGLHYKPDKASSESIVQTIPELIGLGCTSCNSAVAMSLGHERAAAMGKGATEEEARSSFQPFMQRTAKRYWHVLMRKPDGTLVDVTEELER